ncbi:hypothetical protein [Variovorax sp. LjRoot178]|uniref:hypothetical protein n=1 Tax=Variovorax sp. LjRoot178 TaxID=3342277 RepID=UPI003ED05DC5
MTTTTATPPAASHLSLVPAAAPTPERTLLIEAAAKLIFDLLGLKPPPAELITPETFGPMHTFVDEVQAIVSRSRGPLPVAAAATPAARAGAAFLPIEPLWNRNGNVIHAAVDRLGAAQRAAAASKDATPPGMAEPGTWVCDGARVAKVREAYAPTKHEPEGAYDLVIYARNGKKIGRESPAMDGPRGFEPFCSAENWQQIEEPRFPLDRYEYLKSLVTFKPSAGSSLEESEAVEDALHEAPRP